MRLYCASTNDRDVGFLADVQTILSDGDRTYIPHILLSYHYFKNYKFETRLDEQFKFARPTLFCDSGAFSAKMSDAKITVEEYGAWLTKYKDYFQTYANLDVIGDAKGTEYNQQFLESEYGLSPIPVFHLGSSWSELEKLIERYPYIALGGLVPHSKNNSALMKYLIRCFEMAKESGTFYHGFGLTRWETIKSFPFHSVDSSSWNKGVMFGQFSVFNERLGKFLGFSNGDKVGVLKHAREIREMGFDPYVFISKDKYERRIGCKFDGVAWAKAALWLNKYWRQDPSVYWKTSGAPDTEQNGKRFILSKST